MPDFNQENFPVGSQWRGRLDGSGIYPAETFTVVRHGSKGSSGRKSTNEISGDKTGTWWPDNDAEMLGGPFWYEGGRVDVTKSGLTHNALEELKNLLGEAGAAKVEQAILDEQENKSRIVFMEKLRDLLTEYDVTLSADYSKDIQITFPDGRKIDTEESNLKGSDFDFILESLK